jgi:hypothetical protein
VKANQSLSGASLRFPAEDTLYSDPISLPLLT